MRAALVVVVAMLAGCTGNAHPEPSNPGTRSASNSASGKATTNTTTASTKVDADGFSLKLADVVVSGPAGVAPPGTVVTLEVAKVPEQIPQELMRPAVAFDISLAGGLQPDKEVTVTWAGAEPGKSESPVFITRSGTDGQWSGRPVQTVARGLQVTMAHFSLGVFGWSKDLIGKVVQGALKFLGQKYDPPACAPGGRARALDGYVAKVEGGNGVYACVERLNGQRTITVHSNSGFVWQVRPKSSAAVGMKPEAPLDTGQILTVAAFDFLVGESYARKTLLVPGGRAPLKMIGSPSAVTLSADVDAGLGLVAILAAGLQSIPGFKLKQQVLIDIGECAAQIVESAGPKPDVALVVRTVLNCFGRFVEGAAQVIVGIVTSLSGMLVTQLAGAVGEATRSNHLSVRVTLDECSTASVAQGWGAGDPDAQPAVKDCADGWAYLDLGLPGDSQSIMRRVNGRWTRYTGLPASICIDQFRAAGGPKRFERYLHPCEPDTSFELTASGLGPFQLGMSPEDVERHAKELNLVSTPSGECRVVSGPRAEWHVIYWTKSEYRPEGGVNQIRSDRGFGVKVGDSSAEVLKIPGVVAAGGGRWTLDLPGPTQVQFDVSNGQISTMRAIEDSSASTYSFCS